MLDRSFTCTATQEGGVPPVFRTRATIGRTAVRLCFSCLLGAFPPLVLAAPNDPLCQEVWDRVREDYFQTVDKSAFFAACPSSLEKVLNKHSALVNTTPPADKSQSSAAIGIEFGTKEGWPVTVEAFEGSPASEAGIKKKDILLTIDGVSVQRMPLSEVATKLRGPEGSEVRLSVLRDGATLLLPPINRRIMATPTVIAKEIKPGVLWIRVKQFGANTVSNVVDVLLKRWNAKDKAALEGLIFDLRGNYGGRLDAALGLAAAFLQTDTPLIRIQPRSNDDKTILANDDEYIGWFQRARLPPKLKSRPMAILIDKNTAAGAEIVAGTLQSYGKARVIGSPSFGKNTIETLNEIKSQPDTYLKLTTATWSFWDGRSVQEAGVAPDIRVDDEDMASEDVLAKPEDASLSVAIKTLEEWKNLTENELKPTLQRVATLRAKHMRNAALGELDRILTIAPDASEARYSRASLLAELGKKEAAKRDRTLFVRLADKDSKKQVDHLNCWTGIFTGDYTLAEKACQNTLGADPGSVSAWVNLGHLALLQGDTQSAWHHYRMASPMLDGYWPVSLEEMQEDFRLLSDPKHLPKSISPEKIRAVQTQFEHEHKTMVSAIRPADELTLQYMEGRIDETLSLDEQQALLKTILSEEEKRLPSAHPRTLRTLERLAMNYLKQDNYAQALNYFQRAADGYRQLPEQQEKLAFLQKAVRACELRLQKAER